ncbi:MAG: hypothetical protein U0Q55_15060 [Vicinamibacterales bacterium]
MRKNLGRLVMTLVATLVVGMTPAAAADKRPLPATRVQTADGAPVTLDQAGPESRVYVYVTPGSTVSRRLLTAMRGWQLQAPDRVTIVVGGPAAEASAFAVADHGLPGVQWLLDPERTFWTDLQVTGVPTLFGVRAGTIEWRLAGVLNDPAALKGVVASWTTAP